MMSTKAPLPAGCKGQVDDTHGDIVALPGQFAAHVLREGAGLFQRFVDGRAGVVGVLGNDFDEVHGQSPRTLRRLSFWACRRTRSRSARLKPAMAARQRRACAATSSAVKAVSRWSLTPSCLRSSGVSSLELIGVAVITPTPCC